MLHMREREVAYLCQHQSAGSSCLLCISLRGLSARRNIHFRQQKTLWILLGWQIQNLRCLLLLQTVAVQLPVEDVANYLLRSELLPNVQNSLHFSLLLDDSLDKSTHEMVHLPDFAVMEVVTKFLSIVRIQGIPDAKTIFEAVDKCAVEVGLPKENLVCITTDRASVMQGSRNSVTKFILKEWNDFAFKQHCVVYKEVLGVKYALKEIPSFVEETV